MFKCQFCSESIGPRIKPLKVVFDQERYVVRYTNKVLDPETERTTIKETVGSEYSREYDQCPTCAGIAPAKPQPDTTKHQVALFNIMQNHGRTCKKLMEDCRICKANIQQAHSAAPQVLSAGLSDTRVKTFYTSLGQVSVLNSIERFKHKSKRASADVVSVQHVLTSWRKAQQDGSLSR